MDTTLEPDESARSLCREGVIRLQWHPRLDAAPPPHRSSVDIADKLEGMLLGLAIGDALGNTTESQNPGNRRAEYGWIEHYLPNHYAGGRRAGLPSDDTQLAFRTVEQLTADGELRPEELGRRFAQRRIFGIGGATRAALGRFNDGVPWFRCGSEHAGNGALMRIAPVVLPHIVNPTAALWNDTLRAAHLTHDDPLSNASCLAMINALWQVIGMTTAPTGDWWIDEWLQMCDDVGLDNVYHSRTRTIPDGTVQALVRTHVNRALDVNLPTVEACDSWFSGAYLMETVPSVLYILARHADDPRRAILEAVNNTRDNDTAAAIVGAAVGALHGASALPEPWIRDLLGRMNADDDDSVFVLLRAAAERFGYGMSRVLRNELRRRGKKESGDGL
jgi:ADP-ribosyl-[dinitrogen reductase] hydrolase